MTFHIEVIRSGNIERFWPDTASLVERCVKNAVHGEYETSDIKELIAHDRMSAVLVYEDNLPIFICVFEFLVYPRKTVVNICAVGGKKILQCFEYYRKYLFEYWRACGASDMQAEVSPAMERLLAPAGFREIYRTVRRPIS